MCLQRNCYIVRIASSQRTMPYLFCGKTILSVNKCVVMNIWDYYEWETKKYGCGVNYTLKITNAIGEWL